MWLTPCTGSPLARSWNIFHPKPLAWDFIRTEDEELGGPSDGVSEFFFLSKALSQARKHPCKLSVGTVDDSNDRVHVGDPGHGNEGIAPTVFQTLEMHDTLITTYRNLTHLTLHMDSIAGVTMPSEYPDLTGLGDLLISLPGLQYLDLALPAALSPQQQCYTYDQIFQYPDDGRWPNLHDLSIHNIAIRTKDLVAFFSEGLPALRRLSISIIVLLDGRWEWIIQFLHEHLRLESFETAIESGLLYSDGGFYNEGDRYEWYLTEQYNWLLESVASYVERREGCLHPSVGSADLEDREVERERERETREVAEGYGRALRGFLGRGGLEDGRGN